MSDTKTVRVQLARLVREEASVVVEVPTDVDGDELSRHIFENYEEDLEWTPDYEWGSDEGTHQVFESDAEPEVVVHREDANTIHAHVMEFRQSGK
jgi:hypothetical protein